LITAKNYPVYWSQTAKTDLTEIVEYIADPWRTFYKTEEEKVFILTDIDGRRNVEDLLLRRQLR